MEPQARAGLRQPPHCALSSGKHGDSLPLLPGSSRTAAAASQTGPDDLAAELNLCVPTTSSTSCDQPIFVDHATDVSVFSDAVQIEIDWLG